MLAPSSHGLTPSAPAPLAGPWSEAELPRTWPDQSSLRLWLSLLKAPLVNGGEVDVPDDLPGPTVPDYARKPFHGLPNGYYSHSVAQGYDRGFEVSMLGRVGRARARMVEAMLTLPGGTVSRALDLGCGSGRLASSLFEAGIPDVWGLDPSPYLLKIAQERTPGVHFVQGVAEQTPFGDAHFDTIGSCFLFHELPRDAAEASIREIHRILRPGGILTITDPCREHVRPKSLLGLTWKHGLGALYFHFLARGVYEPFLEDWHGLGDHAAWLEAHGFEVVANDVVIPLQFLVARRLP